MTYVAACAYPLDPDPHVGCIELGGDGQAGIDHDREDGVHGADVVQHVAVVQYNACEEDQEVETP